MATVTSKITLTSTDLTSDALDLSVTHNITATHNTGIARSNITSTAKTAATGQVTLYTGGEFGSPLYLYVHNTATNHATDNIVSIYSDTDYTGDMSAAEKAEVIYLKGKEWAFVPVYSANTLKAFASTSGTVIEWMIFGTEA